MDDVYDDHDNDDLLAIGGVLELTLDFHKYNVHFLDYKFLRGTLWCKYLRKSSESSNTPPPHPLLTNLRGEVIK